MLKPNLPFKWLRIVYSFPKKCELCMIKWFSTSLKISSYHKSSVHDIFFFIQFSGNEDIELYQLNHVKGTSSCVFEWSFFLFLKFKRSFYCVWEILKCFCCHWSISGRAYINNTDLLARIAYFMNKIALFPVLQMALSWNRCVCLSYGNSYFFFFLCNYYYTLIEFYQIFNLIMKWNCYKQF